MASQIDKNEIYQSMYANSSFFYSDKKDLYYIQLFFTGIKLKINVERLVFFIQLPFQ